MWRRGKATYSSISAVRNSNNDDGGASNFSGSGGISSSSSGSFSASAAAAAGFSAGGARTSELIQRGLVASWSNQQLASGHGQDQRRSADTTRGVDD